jgi:hypothetical protein
LNPASCGFGNFCNYSASQGREERGGEEKVMQSGEQMNPLLLHGGKITAQATKVHDPDRCKYVDSMREFLATS